MWKTLEDCKTWSIYRIPNPEDEARGLDDIALEEIAAALRTAESDDIVTEVARLFGNKRLTGQGRDRIEAAVGI